MITCTEIIKALSEVCKHRQELQELFDTKFAEIQFQLAKYKDADTAAKLKTFEQVYMDLDRLITMCSGVDYSKKNSE